MSLDEPRALAGDGFVYILTNAAMPGYIKIGLTQADDVAQRLKQLDTTSMPLPFECYYAARVPDCRRIERTLHFVFGEKRTRVNREFFSADPDLVRAVIELVAIKDEEPTDREQLITPEQRAEIEEVKRTKAERLTLDRLGIPIGAELTFTKDPVVTCEVAGARTVRFRGEEQTLSQAALKAIREMGYNWTSARGAEYWAWNGVKLSALPPAELLTS
jgi:hypothetical protein